MRKEFFIKVLIILLMLLIFICVSAVTYADTISNNLANNVLRLHIIANSDSEEDQLLKLKVRDSLIGYMNSICSNVNSKSEAINIVNEHINEFSRIAQTVILENNFDYPVNISIDKSFFPTKYYGDIALPLGIYDALKVEIGNSDGKNWWCVMFPPLCFVDISSGVVPDDSKEILKDSLDDEEFKIITSTDSSIQKASLKFKIVEFVEQIKEKL